MFTYSPEASLISSIFSKFVPNISAPSKSNVDKKAVMSDSYTLSIVELIALGSLTSSPEWLILSQAYMSSSMIDITAAPLSTSLKSFDITVSPFLLTVTFFEANNASFLIALAATFSNSLEVLLSVPTSISLCDSREVLVDIPIVVIFLTTFEYTSIALLYSGADRTSLTLSLASLALSTITLASILPRVTINTRL